MAAVGFVKTPTAAPNDTKIMLKTTKEFLGQIPLENFEMTVCVTDCSKAGMLTPKMPSIRRHTD